MSSTNTLTINSHELRELHHPKPKPSPSLGRTLSSSSKSSVWRVPGVAVADDHDRQTGLAPTQTHGSFSSRRSNTGVIASDIAIPALPAIPAVTEPASATVTLARANLIVLQVSLVNFLVSMSSGVVIIALPRMAVDLSLEERLYLWPASVFGLTTGSALLISGTLADVIGARPVELLAITLLGAFTLACGLSSSGIQLVLFRAFQGVAEAMHLPCSVSLVARYVPSGPRRNLSFACLGLSAPLGFSVGLVLGGVLVGTIGWRAGFYIPGAVMLVQALTSFALIPRAESLPTKAILQKLKSETDWIGAAIASAGLAMFSYVLAILSTDVDNIRKSSSLAMLVLSVCLMIFFPVWINMQERKGRPALVPNHLWKNIPFSTICLLTLFAWGFTEAMELFASLYFQEIQDFSALQASLRLLPNLLMGAMVNLTTGYVIDRTSTFWLVLGAVILTSGSSLLMALIDPHWSYWKGAFFAQCLGPLACDVLFTIGLIVVSEVFPEKTQALAGAVFNTVAYFGMSVGLNLMQVVSLLVTKGTRYRDKNSAAALLQGYRASFWTMFAMMMASVLLCIVGLRKIGQVGLKRN